MFRLTEEEIVAEASKDKEYCQLSVDVGMWAAREQLKRIVGWMSKDCTEHDHGEKYMWRRRCWECFMALKKEAGG